MAALGGAHQWKSTTHANATGFSPILGAGLALQFGPRFALRGEFVYIPSVGDSATTGRSDLTAFTLGALLNF